MGGRGLRKIREVNLALVSKLGWKLLNRSDSLWVSQLHGKYLNSSSFLSLSGPEGGSVAPWAKRPNFLLSVWPKGRLNHP